MSLPLGPIAPSRLGARPRDVGLSVVGTVALAAAMALTALQTRWVGDWGTSDQRGTLTMALVIPPLVLAVFGIALVVRGWRRRPFESFWTSEVRADHYRRLLLLVASVLALMDVVLLLRFGFELVDAIERAA
jgi:hypothetical protein